MRLARNIQIGLAVALCTVLVLVLTRPDPVSKMHGAIGSVAAGYAEGMPFVPPPAPVGDADAFRMWQRDLRRRLDLKFGFGDTRTAPVRFEVHETETLRGGLVRKTLTFEASDGARIPAVLQLPSRTRPGPAILLIPGHTKPEESGLSQLVYEHDAYQHAAATALAHDGFVTLAFELRGFGLLGRNLNTEHRLVAYNALLDGSFYKKLVLSDALDALALLDDLDTVDKDRIGVAGVSLGGELAVTLAVLSDRFRAVYFSGFGGRTGPFPRRSGDRYDQPHYCHIIPGIGREMRKEDIILLLAPRPALGMRGGLEGPVTEDFRTMTGAGWGTYGSDAFDFAVRRGGGHEFFVPEAIEFFRRTLGNGDP